MWSSIISSTEGKTSTQNIFLHLYTILTIKQSNRFFKKIFTSFSHAWEVICHKKGDVNDCKTPSERDIQSPLKDT